MMGVEVSQNERITPSKRKKVVEACSIVIRAGRDWRNIYIEDAQQLPSNVDADTLQLDDVVGVSDGGDVDGREGNVVADEEEKAASAIVGGAVTA